MPAAFAYDRPASIDDALALLHAHGADAKLLAGGQSLLPLMKLRLARPDRLIDIGRLELQGTRRLDDGGLAIGALTTYAALLGDAGAMACALLGDAVPRIGDAQVRNLGTVGGGVAHADPASDMPAILLALGVELLVRSAERGTRTIPITAFFEGPFQTALEPDELLIEIRIPGASGSYGSAYAAIEQPASGYAIAGVAAVVGSTAGDGVLDDVRIAVTGVGDHPYRAAGLEAALRGSRLERAEVAGAAALVTSGIDVGGDIHADREYRAAMAAVMARRAIEQARARVA